LSVFCAPLDFNQTQKRLHIIIYYIEELAKLKEPAVTTETERPTGTDKTGKVSQTRQPTPSNVNL
jgi:hypothetical protein